MEKMKIIRKTENKWDNYNHIIYKASMNIYLLKLSL
jgi:hypothetical protein